MVRRLHWWYRAFSMLCDSVAETVKPQNCTINHKIQFLRCVHEDIARHRAHTCGSHVCAFQIVHYVKDLGSRTSQLPTLAMRSEYNSTAVALLCSSVSSSLPFVSEQAMASCQSQWTAVYKEDLYWRMVYQYYGLGFTYRRIANINVDTLTMQCCLRQYLRLNIQKVWAIFSPN